MLEIGSLVDDKYKILEIIGQGGMSVVYLAVNERANRRWAIKELRKDGIKDFEVVRQGLVIETEVLKKLSHPGLPGIIDVIDREDTFLIVMDYIEGNPLDKILEEFGAQSQEDVTEWGKQLCDVLHYLHTRTPSIIYRDMKPANIMLKPDGRVTLIDFGTAREFKELNLADTTCLGTVGYAAPEQFGGMGQTDVRTDVYCLGATLYHLVTGKNPGEPPYEMKPIREIDPTLSKGLEKIIIKCTQRNPEDRFQSCEELQYALQHYNQLEKMSKRKHRKEVGKLVASIMLTILCGAVSVLGFCRAEAKKSEDYERLLWMASDYHDYYKAILIDPAREEAYLQFVDYLTADSLLGKGEAQQLLKLQAGLERTIAGVYSARTDVLNELRRENKEGYEEVCYRIGESFLFYYDIESDRIRYNTAAKWFSEAKNHYESAEIFCDISECLTLLQQYDGSKVMQTGKMYTEYEKLWNKIEVLEKKAGSTGNIDIRIQVWKEISHMVDARITHFLEVVSSEELCRFLIEISEKAGSITEPVMQEELQALLDSISQTIQRIEES